MYQKYRVISKKLHTKMGDCKFLCLTELNCEVMSAVIRDVQSFVEWLLWAGQLYVTGWRYWAFWCWLASRFVSCSLEVKCS